MLIPTLRQLQFLVALGDTGSFSRAAEACHVTQPTLSAGIKELEELLGVKLAEREARGARLTHAGELAVQRASALLNDAHALVQAVQSAGALLTGPFHLGAIPTIAPYFLPEVLRRFSQEFPLAQLIIQEETTDKLIKSCTQGKIDVGILALPISAKYLEIQELFEEELLLVVPPNHPLAVKSEVCLGDVEPLPFVLLDEAAVGPFSDGRLRQIVSFTVAVRNRLS